MYKSKVRLICVLLALLLAVSTFLSACGDSSDESAGSQGGDKNTASAAQNDNADTGETSQEDTTPVETYDLSGNYSDTVALGAPASPLDPGKVYQEVTYIPEMFVSNFTLLGGDSAIEEFKKNAKHYKFNEAASGGGVEREITTLPFELEARTYKLEDNASGAGIIYIMNARFFDQNGDKDLRYFTYSIEKEGDKNVLLLQNIKDIQYTDAYTGISGYTEGQLNLKYYFTFKGFNLTLESDGEKVVLSNAYYYIDDQELHLSNYGFLSKGSPMIDHIAGFNIYYKPEAEYNSFNVTFINDRNEDETSRYCHGQLTDSGLFTFTVPYATETKTYQYVFFYLGSNGMILTDGKTNYKYTTDEDDFKAYKLGTVLGDDTDVDSLSDDDEKQLIEAQNAILMELEAAFKSRNMEAVVDPATGRVTLDSNILFAKNSYELSADGKGSLDEFLAVYTSVVLSENNKNLVGSIVVEGHTDTDGDHASNQTLSEKRAKAVADYCTSKIPALKNIITSKGYSYDDPVYKDDGSVDMDASRRVVFKFKLEKK